MLKDEPSISGTSESKTCGNNAIREERAKLYEGSLIKESLDDETLLDYIRVHKVELWNTGGAPKYWTVIFFTSNITDFPELASKALISDPQKGGNWFVDFKCNNTKFIVFKNKILKYTIGNEKEKAIVCNECRMQGISNTEMNWSE